jgi:hypothetical protein
MKKREKYYNVDMDWKGCDDDDDDDEVACKWMKCGERK